MPLKDPEKRAEYQREYSQRPEVRRREEASERKRMAEVPEYKAKKYRRCAIRKSKGRAWLHKLKASKGCCVCGNKNPLCLDFHHRDPANKLFTIGRSAEWGVEKLELEIEKCNVLCANCHRITEWESRSHKSQ